MVDVGDRVDLDPFTGTITLPEAFVTMLREAGAHLHRGRRARRSCSSTRPTTRSFAFFEFGPTELPDQGALTVAVEGEADRCPSPGGAVRHSILLTGFGLFIDTGVDEPGADMFCKADDDVVVDTFEARATPTPTVTVTAAPPVRPVVVQTDFAGRDDASPAPALAAGALLTLAAGAVGVGRARRGSTRRH